MVGQAVLVAICSVGAGVLGLIAGLLIMFVVKSCRTDSDNSDTEKGLSYAPRRESLPRENCFRDGHFDWRPLESVATVTPIMRDSESGVYCRISKFDIPVITEDAAIQTSEGGGHYVYLSNSEQAVQCDIIKPSQSDQPTSPNDHVGGMSYSAYRHHVREAFNSWQVLPAVAIKSQLSSKDGGGWPHPKLDNGKQANKTAEQDEAEQDILVIKLTSETRNFLHMNGLCETTSSIEVSITNDKTSASSSSQSSPTEQFNTTLQGSSHGNRVKGHFENALENSETVLDSDNYYMNTDPWPSVRNQINGHSEVINTTGNSETVLEADSFYSNLEDYLPMDGQSDDDYLPMRCQTEDDEYLFPQNADNYTYLSSLLRQTSSTKPGSGCIRPAQPTVTSPPAASNASSRPTPHPAATGVSYRPTQHTVTSIPVSSGALPRNASDTCSGYDASRKAKSFSSECPNKCYVKQGSTESTSEDDDDYLQMTTKTKLTNEDYYNCSHMKKDADDYIPIDEDTLPRGCGKLRQQSS